MKILKKKVLLIIFIILFGFGFFMILKSGNLDFGSYGAVQLSGTNEAVQLSGTILCTFSGIGILFELYKNPRL